jgi:hypothetical protein
MGDAKSGRRTSRRISFCASAYASGGVLSSGVTRARMASRSLAGSRAKSISVLSSSRSGSLPPTPSAAPTSASAMAVLQMIRGVLECVP